MESFSFLNEDGLMLNHCADDIREDVEQQERILVEEQRTMDVDIETVEKEGVGEDQLQGGYQKKQRKKSSKVWDEMTIVKHGNIDKVPCNHCKDLLTKMISGTTTHYQRHLKGCLQRKKWLGEQSKHKQQVLSFTETTLDGSEYPTSNLFLVELKEIKDILNAKALDYSENIRAMAARMADKFDKYWGNCNVLISLAAILDLRYKMKLINIAFVVLYGENDSNEKIEKIQQKLNDLYNEYVAAHISSNKEENERLAGNIKGRKSRSSSICEETGVVGKGILTGKAKFQMLMSELDTTVPEKSELQIYLTENRYNYDVHANIDVIGWWKGERLRFPILSKMAVDILSIPITSVASESIFSAGGRVIDDRRASMLVDTVQMLLCASDWVRNIHGIKRNWQDEQDGIADAFQKIALDSV